MLLIALAALAVAWVTVAAVVLGMCASAAAGDRALARETKLRSSEQRKPVRLRRIA